jgi:O-antigen/teichoic acid export membrane protein
MKYDQLKNYFTTFYDVPLKYTFLWHHYGSMIRQFVLVSFSTMIVRGAHVICMPLILHYVAPIDYGLLALINSFIAISSACMGLGLRQCLPLYYFEQDHTGKQVMINHIACIYAMIAPAIGIAVGLFFVHYALPQLEVPWFMLWCAVGISFCMFFVELCYQVFQYHQQVAYLTLLQLMQAAITIGSTISISVLTAYSFCAPLLAQALSICCMSLIAIYCWYRNAYALHWYVPTLLQVRSYLATSLCFLPSMLFGWVLAACQRWVVAHYLGLADVGIYAVADGLCQLSQLVCTYAMVGSHMPHMLRKFVQQPDATLRIEYENRCIMWCAMVAGALLLIGARYGCMPLLRMLIHERFAQALHYLFPLLIGSIFLLGAHFLAPLLQYKKKRLFLGCSLAVPAGANIILGILLVPRMGLYGAVVAQVSAYVGYFGMNLWYNQRLLNEVTNARNASGCNGS